MQNLVTTNESTFPSDAGALQTICMHLGVPPALWDLFEFIGVRFRHRKARWAASMAMGWCERSDWILILPVKTPGHTVEIPLPAEIDKDDPEGHWRAILAAAADFQYLVNSGQYHPG